MLWDRGKGIGMGSRMADGFDCFGEGFEQGRHETARRTCEASLSEECQSFTEESVRDHFLGRAGSPERVDLAEAREAVDGLSALGDRKTKDKAFTSGLSLHEEVVPQTDQSILVDSKLEGNAVGDEIADGLEEDLSIKTSIEIFRSEDRYHRGAVQTRIDIDFPSILYLLAQTKQDLVDCRDHKGKAPDATIVVDTKMEFATNGVEETVEVCLTIHGCCFCADICSSCLFEFICVFHVDLCNARCTFWIS